MTSQKVLRRILIGAVILVGLVLGIQWLTSLQGDLDLGTASTVGMIAAVQLEDDGQSAVIVKEDGTVVKNNGWQPGNQDRDLAWDPDGQRLFFVSDRQEETFHVYRWNPDKNNVPEKRSIDKAGRSSMFFDLEKHSETDRTALITTRGTVQRFNPKDGSFTQVLPPSNSAGATEEGGSTTAMEGTYGRLGGTSFRNAVWLKERTWAAAVMRTDDGEILLVQPLFSADGKPTRPQVIMAAKKIDMAVNPKTGALVFTFMDFQFPPNQPIPEESIKNGKVVRPFAHGIGLFDPSAETAFGLVAGVPDDKTCFSSPAVSPDGASFVVVVGEYTGDGSIDARGLFSIPFEVGGASKGSPLLEGEVYEPSWNPAGDKLVYIRKTGSNRAIYSCDSSGGGEKNLTGDKGDFMKPIFSPQVK